MVGLQAWPAEVKLPNSVQSPKSSRKPEPATPKQRKQAAYASSMSFDSGSLTADHKNPQDPSRQLQVSTDTEKARGPPLKVRVSIPSPRDCKATMLQSAFLRSGWWDQVSPDGDEQSTAVEWCKLQMARRKRERVALRRRRPRCSSLWRMSQLKSWPTEWI